MGTDQSSTVLGYIVFRISRSRVDDEPFLGIWIEALAVDAAQIRRGIASGLVRAIFLIAESLKADSVQLQRLDDSSKEFYQSLAFEDVDGKGWMAIDLPTIGQVLKALNAKLTRR